MAVGQKYVPIFGTLVSGSMDQNLRSPGGLILTHTQIRVTVLARLLTFPPRGPAAAATAAGWLRGCVLEPQGRQYVRPMAQRQDTLARNAHPPTQADLRNMEV